MALFAILVIGFVVGISAFLLVVKTKLAGERAIALSKFSSQFGIYDTVRLHDWALGSLVNSRICSWGNANLSRSASLNFRLEVAVALRDRFDELVGKASGPMNKVEIRTKLAMATASLSPATSFDDGLELKMKFMIGEEFPTDGSDWLAQQMALMEQIYLSPGRVDSIRATPGMVGG